MVNDSEPAPAATSTVVPEFFSSAKVVIKMDRVPPQPVKDPPNLLRVCPFDLDRLLSRIDPGPAEESKAYLVVDTDVASFIFKWHPEFAPRYVSIIRGAELVVSFMTLAEMRQGALDANWGPRKRDLLEAYLTDGSVLHSDNLLCSTWARIRNESVRKGRQTGYQQPQGLSALGQPQTRFRRRITR